MKNKILKIAIMCIVLVNLTGCTKYMKDSNNKIIKNEVTGQNLPINILCKPTDSTTLKIYEEYNETTKNNKVDLENLPACTTM